MVSINYATKEVCCKIVYYGPGLSGKTTNLQYVHEKTPTQTRGKLISLATEADRTLYFDFLPINLGSINGFAAKFQLYTVPGQVYYNATRKLVLRGVDGVVFVADAQADKLDDDIESLSNLKENLEEYGYDVTDLPIVIQYNKSDLPTALPIAELDAKLNTLGWPSYTAVAVKGEGVFDTLKAIMKLVLEKARTGGTKTKSRKAAPASASAAKPEAAAPDSALETAPVTTGAPMLGARPAVESQVGQPIAAQADSSSGSPAPKYSGAPTLGAPPPQAQGSGAVPTRPAGPPAGAKSIFGAPRKASATGRIRKLGGSGSLQLKGSGGIPLSSSSLSNTGPMAQTQPVGAAADMNSTDKLSVSGGAFPATQPMAMQPAAAPSSQAHSNVRGVSHKMNAEISGTDPLEQTPQPVKKKKSGFFRRLFG